MLKKIPMDITDALDAARVEVTDPALIALMDPKPSAQCMEDIARMERAGLRALQQMRARPWDYILG